MIVETETTASSSPVSVPRLVEEEPLRRAVDELDVPDFLK